MRGCLRLVSSDFTTWAEIPSDYWAGNVESGVEIPTIPEPKMIPGSETPDYGVGMEDGGYDLWFCIPEQPLENGLTPIENDDDIFTFLNMLVYSKLLKEERVGDMIDEAEKHKQIVENENENENGGTNNENEGLDDDEESFEGDNSNIDSSESEAKMPPPKKKRRIPPPNPPYRTRKRGRNSMLRGLFKNTSDNPVIEEDEGPPATQSS
ncbi:hypothetical protein ACET3Z_013277 [Daucus carota]